MPVIGKEDEPVEVEDLSESAIGETVKLLNDSSLLFKIGFKLEKQGFIGDLENKLAVYLSGTTKDYPRNERISTIAEGEAGVGKTTLQSILEMYFNSVYSYHRMTAHAADYWAKKIGTLDGKILLIKQMEGSEASQYTVMILIDPISGGLKLLTTSGAPGEKTTEEIILQGTPVMHTTTVRFVSDSQTIRRFYTIYPDETPEQTKRIMIHKAKMRSDISYRAQVESIDQDLKRIPVKLKEESAIYGIMTPFAKIIANRIPPVLLARSDIEKIYNFINAVTHLYYKQRFSYKDIEGNQQLIASPIDYYYAWQIVKVSIPKRLGGITDDRSYKIFQIMQELCMRHGTASSDDVLQAGFKKGMNYAKNTIYQTLSALGDQGFVTSEKDPSNKSKNIYSLTSKAYVPFGITFPDIEIEDAYINFIAEEISNNNELSKDDSELLQKSMRAIDLVTGSEITQNIVSEKTRKMLML